MLALQRALRRTISRLPNSFCKRRVDDLSRRVDDLSRCVSTGRKSCEPQENVTRISLSGYPRLRTGALASRRSCSTFPTIPSRSEFFPRTNRGKVAPRYSRLDDLTPVIFVTTGGVQSSYSAGNTTSTPFFFSNTTTNFAGFVELALRPTVCTSSGPS